MIFKSKTLTEELTDASLRVALNCGIEALQAAKNHRLGLPATMSPEEAENTWREANRVLRDLEVWAFPQFAGLNWPGAQKDNGKCDKLN